MNYLLLNLLGYRLVISFESVDTYYEMYGTDKASIKEYNLKNVNIVYIKIDDGISRFGYYNNDNHNLLTIIPNNSITPNNKYISTIKEDDHLNILSIRINETDEKGAINILENIDYEDVKLYLEVIE